MSLIVNAPQGPSFNQNETPTARPLGDLWWQRKAHEMSGCNGVVWGGQYGFGQGGAGYIGAGSGSSVDRVQFSNDAVGAIASNVGGTGNHGAAAHGSANGYFFSIPNSNNVYRLVFSTDATSSFTTTLTVSSGTRTCANESTTCAYQGGSTQINKLVFSGETLSTVTSTLVDGHSDGAGFSSATNGFFLCDNPSSRNDRLLFATEALTQTGNTPRSATSIRGMESGTHGYLVGGYEGGNVSTVDKMLFTSEAWSRLASNLTSAKDDIACMSSFSKGYGGGGYSGTNIIERIDFTTESIASLSSTMVISRTAAAAMENRS